MKHFKKITSLFLALLMVISAGAALTVSTSAGGADTDIQADYTISNAEELITVLETNAKDNSYYKDKTVALANDIDLSGTIYTKHLVSTFSGVLDGCGHAIKGLTINATSGMNGFIQVFNGEMKNISFIDSNVKSTVSCTGIVASAIGSGKAVFDNVYVSGTVSGTTQVGGFVGSIMSTGKTLEVKNCVSNVKVTATGYGSSGFLGNLHKQNQASFSDCAFVGDLSACTYIAAGFVGWGTGNITVERCVSLGTVAKDLRGSLIYLDHQNELNSSVYSNIKVADCYAACGTGLNPIGISSSRGFYYNLSVSYGGKVVYTHSDQENGGNTIATGIYTKLSEINNVLSANNAYMAKGTEVNTTAKNFYEKCPALSNWVLTEETVAYGSGMNVVKVVPRGIYSKTLASPVGITGIQTRKSDEGYDVRFVGTVNFEDLEKYETVGFMYEVKHNGALLTSGTEETSDVFSSIIAADETVTAEALNANAIFVAKLTGFASEEKFDITITVFAKTADGTVIYDYSGASTFTACNPEA